MFEEIFERLQSLHFNILSLNLTKVNWVEGWSKTQLISLIRPKMWVSSVKDENN